MLHISLDRLAGIGESSAGESLCIVMPAHNEEGCIERVCREWLVECAARVDATLIVVDDGSQDRTGLLLDSLARQDDRFRIVHQANAGHGAALRRGYAEALQRNPDWVLQVDSDDQVGAGDFARLWARRGESAFILGCRRQRHDPLHRKVLSRIMRGLIRLLFGFHLLDPNVPYRLMRGDYLRELLRRIPADVYAPNVFLSIRARLDHAPLLEIPVTHQPRRTGRTAIIRRELIRACLRSWHDLWSFYRKTQRTHRS